MSDSTVSEHGGMSREEMMSALFAHMVIQQSNMAMMLLGEVPHPQTGEKIRDLEAAKLFIDQLEMFEVKTKGNLTQQEQQLLKQSLMSLRMAFVEAARTPAPKERAEAKPQTPAPEPAAPKVEPGPATPTEEESKKKFSKKY